MQEVDNSKDEKPIEEKIDKSSAEYIAGWFDGLTHAKELIERKIPKFIFGKQ